MFRRRCNGKLVSVTALPFHNASKRIVFCGSLCFVSQQLFNFFRMRDKKGPIQIDKSSWFTSADLGTGGAKCYLLRAPMLALFI